MPILGCLCSSISIRAPRMGSDLASPLPFDLSQYFNPRSRMGSDLDVTDLVGQPFEFQSTLPAWGATRNLYYLSRFRIISIHAPRMGSDIHAALRARAHNNFNPRSPHGERPLGGLDAVPVDVISIHAPRMGSDQNILQSSYVHHHFNPRSPHGERHADINCIIARFEFQSTLPAWGATAKT